MTIAWKLFTPWAAQAGGALVGLATALFLLGTGRVAGISGLVARPLALRWTRALGQGSASAGLFVLAMLAGMALHDKVLRRR